jgi:enolase-phosphatase E1
VLAQQLLFGSTDAGDLTSCIGHFFDTTVGTKRSPESYRRIAYTMGRAPGQLLFLSDVHAELDAARSVGLQTALCVRPGNAEQPAGGEPTIHTFDDISA